MKLLFCIKSLNIQGGGAEHVLTDVANGLVAHGNNVIILTYDKPGTECFFSLDARIELIQLGIGSTTQRAQVYETIKRIWALRCTILNIQPDIVVGFMHSMYIPLGVAMLGSGIPVIASEHTIPEYYRSHPLERFLLLISSFLVSRFTCVSPQVQKLFPNVIRRKMDSISNPVTANSNSCKIDLGANETCNMILTVGRLEEQKNHMMLISSFKLIADECPCWTLRIVGEGSLRHILLSHANDLGIADRVQIPGAKRDVSSEYNNAQIFVVPSKFESFGLALAEALAHGLPAIGFNFHGQV